MDTDTGEEKKTGPVFTKILILRISLILRIFLYLFYLFGVLRRFQHCTGHITTGSWKGRGNQYIQFVRVLYCKLPTNGKQLPAFPLEAVLGIEPRPQRWEARVLPLCHRGPWNFSKNMKLLYVLTPELHPNTENHFWACIRKDS